MKTKKYGLMMLALFVLGIIPMSLFGSYHNLTSQVPESLGITFTLLTDSAGSKGFLITLTLLLLSLFRFKPSRIEWIQKLSMLGLLLVIGFASKTGLKLMTESPRPYTELLAAEQLIEHPDAFYQLDTKQQANVINQISEHVSDWRTRHWQGEKDYSFPSGHTIFVSICLAFFGGLFLQNKCYISALSLWMWGMSVAYSRLWLGMHRPEDLIGSVLFVAIVFTLLPTFQIKKQMPFVSLASR
ncbi:phosphatase PAP2 family protein [Vibrio alginolyticus]|jgi:phosphatidylglycerophosphatase B|uniref:undecaprenyl-diphosphate phosphatase n=3 Tax=Vibrio alginolyticus TaxID=663 RepID=A0A7H8DWM4_VIBAL|nr:MULTISPECIES: phosphatase PAP2 family protein [Vibrio]MDW1972145.1 phosphatase PAP2 family protein [Vibrio sp. 945]ANP67997.1 phospholipid phosphatase [Vibrio alginolyticus]AVF63276.1 phosphatase PAP2 family protein [Vibrio alginolyticus]AVF67604.1 phosphatase PAP2 family protein [Vibrio alginolyticus]EAS75258.1 putative phosphatidylglycerophosphatase B [Vibrio alginolyticus 12G01]